MCATAPRFEGFERIMAETGVAIAAARAAAVAELAAAIAAAPRRGVRAAPFPWAELALVGTLEAASRTRPAVDVEDDYVAPLRPRRERDRAAGRTLDGPHRSDLVVGHGPKEMPAKVCSTGEQKALLIGLVLAHADLVARSAATAPRRSCCSTRSRPISTRCGGPRCSTKSSLWAARRGCRAPIRRPSRRSAERAQFCRVEEGRIARLRLRPPHGPRAPLISY